MLGDRGRVEPVSSGGFDLAGAEFTPQRLAELAKMDGGIVIDADASNILKANVHLIPDPSIATDETGTRQRTAERVARQTGLPVISISEGRGTATVFTRDGQFGLESPTELFAKANQSVQSLERFRRRMDDATDALTRAEVEDVVTGRELALPLQRAALVEWLAKDVNRHAVELGQEGDLIRLQLIDLLDGVEETADLIFSDYSRRRTSKSGHLRRLDGIGPARLRDLSMVASALGLPSLDSHVRPRGLRVLSRVPRLPEPVKVSLIDHFGDFQKLLHASVADLDQVDGVGRTRAQLIRHYFDQLLDSTPVWRFTDD